MADPGLRSYLYTEAERSMQELVNKGAISPGGHAEIMKILRSEQGGGQQMGYPGPYPAQPVGYQNYPNQAQYQPYPVQQAPPPQQQAPTPHPQNPPPEKQHSHMGDFGKRMGNNVVNGMSSGFGLTLGSDVANSLWHKVT